MIEIHNCPICGSLIKNVVLQCKDYTATLEEFKLKQCNNCSLVITTPRPVDLDKYYRSEEYISHSTKAKSFTDRLYMLARKFTITSKFGLIERNIQIGRTHSLLDIGCGTGEFLKYCQQKGWDTTGVEPTFESESRPNEKIYKSLTDVRDKTFDRITLWHVLEHIPDIIHTIQWIKNSLAENGTIYIAVPNYNSHDSKYYKKYWAAYDVPRHLWHFSQQAMAELISNNGLRLVESIPMKLDSYYVSLLSEKYKNNNTTSVISMMKAFLVGFQSNLNSKKNSEYSSLIYVIKK